MEDLNTTPRERLKWALKKLKITPYKFSKGLDYKSPDTVYNILNGKNGICSNFLFRIQFSQYPINQDWLKSGFGHPFNHPMETGVGNEICIRGKNGNIIPRILNFEFIKKITDNLIPVIGFGSESYKVEARIAGIVGLEIKITTFCFERRKGYADKYYSIIISPDWKVSNLFEFWRINDSTMKCENLSKIECMSQQILMNAIYPVHQEIARFVVSQPDRKISEDFQFLKSSGEFTELYITDPKIRLLEKDAFNKVFTEILN